jgi:hypothetical protein
MVGWHEVVGARYPTKSHNAEAIMAPQFTGEGSTPLFIAVTGHRTISSEDAEEIAKRAREALKGIQSLVPHTSVCIVSGLADGADRIVARAGLDLGMRLEAVVAAPVEQYRSGLTSASRNEFDAFLQLPGASLTQVPVAGNTTSEGPEAEETGQYVAVGHYLASRANLLFVVWGGDLTGLAGGTADVLLRFLGAGEGVSPTTKMRFLDGDKIAATGPEFALWFRVSQSQNDVGVVPNELPIYLTGVGSRTLACHASMPYALDQQLRELEHYNLSVASHRKVLNATPETDALLADSRKAGDDDRDLLAAIELEFRKADRLAVKNQRRSDRLFLAFAVMAALTGTLFLAYEVLHHARPYLIAYLMLLLAGLCLLQMSKRMRWFRRHLLYRTLAEVLRTRLYLAGAGMRDSPLHSGILPLSGVTRYPGYGLVSLVSKTVEPTFKAGDPRSPGIEDSRFAAVQQHWIDMQIGYFETKTARLLFALKRLGWVKSGLVALTVLGLICLLFFAEDLASVDLGAGVTARLLAIFFVAILPFLVGVWSLYESKLATTELLWLYRDQADSYKRARSALATATSREEREDILVELSRSSTMQNLLWVIHRYHREHEPPC